MRLPSTSPARIKNIIHAFQAFTIFLGWTLTIAVFTKGDGIDGRSGWYFGMVCRQTFYHLHLAWEYIDDVSDNCSAGSPFPR